MTRQTYGNCSFCLHWASWFSFLLVLDSTPPIRANQLLLEGEGSGVYNAFLQVVFLLMGLLWPPSIADQVYDASSPTPFEWHTRTDGLQLPFSRSSRERSLLPLSFRGE